MPSLYLHRILQLTRQHGNLAEQQLLQRWHAEIDALLAPADRSLLNGQTGLEFGLEDTLCLKINLKYRSPGLIPAVLGMAKDSPTLEPWARLVMQHQLKVHCGIKVMPDRVSREFYIYPKAGMPIATLTGKTPFTEAAEQLNPLFLGIDDTRGYSMYFSATDTGWVDILRQELGLADWSNAHLWAWQQMRYDGEKMIAGKTALELNPMPANILARFASHYPFPYFKYLIPLKQHSSGNFGRDPVTGRFALYGTVN